MTKGRWLVVVLVVLALILAALATGGVFLYSDGVPEPAAASGRMGAVVVSKVDIPAGTDLNELIRGDQFRLILIPESAVVDGAVTSISQLTHRRTRVAVLAGEQIPAGWLTTRAERGSS